MRIKSINKGKFPFKPSSVISDMQTKKKSKGTNFVQMRGGKPEVLTGDNAKVLLYRIRKLEDCFKKYLEDKYPRESHD